MSTSTLASDAPLDAPLEADAGSESPHALSRVPAVFLVVGVLVLLALVMRTYDLGQRASHHDESLHALFSYRFAEGKGYSHDPLMHGPLQFHLIAFVFKLFGASDGLSRVPAALVGTALVALPLLLRRYLGTWGVIAASLLLVLSPSLLYYSRFARNEAFVAVETVLLAVAIWRYREEGGMRWLVALAAAVALQFATKETAFLISAVFLLYVNGALTGVLLDRLGVEGRERWWSGLLLFPIAWVFAATWPISAKRFGEGERPREVDLMVVLGTLVLPFLGAGLQIPLAALGIELDGRSERVVGGLIVSALIVISGEIGVWWDWRRWAVLAAIMYVITILLFTTFFTNPAGFAGAFWTQLDYWLAQQSVQRGTQPFHYYAFMVPLYELLALVPALVGGAVLLARGDRLVRLLGWWALGVFLALSFAGEKMPWLTVHIALPLAILGGYALGRGLERLLGRAWGSTGQSESAGASTGTSTATSIADLRLAAAPTVLVLTLLFALTVRNGFAVAYGHPDTPHEPLIYTQTSPDVPVLARQLEAIADERGGKDQVTVIVDSAESMSWPWAWYLRDFTQASYVQLIEPAAVPPEAILLLWDGTLRARPSLAERYTTSATYRHRWWFPEEGYRSWTSGGLASRLGDGSLLGDVASFLWNGEDRAHFGTLEGVALFPEPPPAATLPTTGVTYGR